jgi:polyphenol oxidase
MIDTLAPHGAPWQRVRVHSTTRAGGVSSGPYASLNLAMHVGDEPAAVMENRRRVREAFALPAEPCWLEQVHGREVLVHDGSDAPRRADAAVAFEPGRVCAVMTADCLPVVLTDRRGSRIAVAHAGWRGLAGGVLEATVAALHCEPRELVAWLGPCIGPAAFEVGDEVREAFVDRAAANAAAFRPTPRGRWWADLPMLAELALRAAGVADVDVCGDSTYDDARRYYSYRRDGRTGRMATLAWLP